MYMYMLQHSSTYCNCEISNMHFRNIMQVTVRKLSSDDGPNSICRSTGAYTQILYKVVSQDVVRFSAVFLVFLVSFSGCLYFALRSEVQVATNSTGNTTIFMTDLGLYPYETRYYGTHIYVSAAVWFLQVKRIGYVICLFSLTGIQ